MVVLLEEEEEEEEQQQRLELVEGPVEGSVERPVRRLELEERHLSIFVSVESKSKDSNRFQIEN